MSHRLAAICLAFMFCIAASSLSSQSAPGPGAKQAAPKAGMVKPPSTVAEKIASALSAAPASIAKDATVMDMEGMKVLRPGSNGWTCFPDTPSPGVDPMCVDKNGMDWANAWMAHKDPPAGKMALAYMLAGGSDASNTDPFATQPKPGEKWVDTGPHIMVLNVGDMFTGYPTTATNTKVPYVMFPGTPYAHLMIPIK